MSSNEEITLAQRKFTNWVKDFEVYKTMAEDELEVSPEIKPFVWTEFQNDDECFVSPGYTKADPDLRMPVVGYFLSRLPALDDGDDYEVVSTEMRLDCSDCFGEGEGDDGDECESCAGEGGTYVEFSLDDQ